MKVADLLGITNDFFGKTKLHFAIGARDRFEPLYVFFEGKFQGWQETQNKKNFERDYIVSFIYYKKDEWLFAGIYQSFGVVKKPDQYYYNTKLLDISSDLIGRLVVRYKKLFRQSYPYLEKCIDQLELVEILREPYTVEPFPGYEHVKIQFALLKSIVFQEENSWKTALSIVKGVYLISDLANGKHYVGSAYGKDAIWNRWSEYIKTGHGGNTNLKKLIAENGLEHATNFQFTILETRSMNAEDDEIIERESFWKDILLSRQFGYNEN